MNGFKVMDTKYVMLAENLFLIIFPFWGTFKIIGWSLFSAAFTYRWSFYSFFELIDHSLRQSHFCKLVLVRFVVTQMYFKKEKKGRGE